MSTQIVDMTQFIDDALFLATSLENDIMVGDKISSGTVLALSKFVATSEPVLTAMAAQLDKKGDLQ